MTVGSIGSVVGGVGDIEVDVAPGASPSGGVSVGSIEDEDVELTSIPGTDGKSDGKPLGLDGS